METVGMQSVETHDLFVGLRMLELSYLVGECS